MRKTEESAQHPAERGAGFDFRWSKKPLTYVTLHSEEVKVMQLYRNLNVTTGKMSNNGGTRLREQRDRLHFYTLLRFF